MICLVLVALLYGAFPLIFAAARRSPVSKKKYKGLCYCINVAATPLALMVTATPTFGAAYILSTWLFSALGLKILKARGLLEDKGAREQSFSHTAEAAADEQANERTPIFCSKCGAKLRSGRFCGACGAQIDVSGES